MYIRLYSKYSLLFLWLLIATATSAQRFGTVANPSVAIDNQRFDNPLLQSRSATPVVSRPQPINRNVSFGNTQVYSSDLFNSKYRSTGNSGGGAGFAGSSSSFSAGGNSGFKGGGNVKTINSISAYQGISIQSVNASSPGTRGGGAPPPPPPTPDPGTDDPTHQLPIGDALWFMLILACGYGALLLKRRKA